MKNSIQINKLKDLNTGITNKVIKNFAGIIADKEIYCKYKINIIFVDNKYISELNSKFFKKENPTDVISFNLTEKEEQILEGEIYISVDAAKEQAIEYNVTYDEELHRLVAHGILHLAGYRDETEKERTSMFNKQEEYIKQFI